MIVDREQYFANRLALVWASQVVEGLLQPACVCVCVSYTAKYENK